MAYTYTEENEQDYSEDYLREKMKKWGILKDEMTSRLILASSSLNEIFKELIVQRSGRDIYEEIDALKKRVQYLEKRAGGKRKLTKADFVVELNKKELETKYFGKIVAIDADSLEVVGIGDTILEAYNNAKEKTGKDQFDFRRIGYSYVYRV
ncbi:MAG TPA: hypothetical protein VIH48_05020 [Candidatus Bathyarchaeia archaeon]